MERDSIPRTTDVDIKSMGLILAKECQICGDAFQIDDLHKDFVICPRCRNKLKKLLYGDDE